MSFTALQRQTSRFFYWFDMSFHTVFSVLRPSQETRFILTLCSCRLCTAVYSNVRFVVK